MPAFVEEFSASTISTGTGTDSDDVEDIENIENASSSSSRSPSVCLADGTAPPPDVDRSGSVHLIEVNDAPGELSRNLPDLIDQLKLLRTNMERSSTVFETMVSNAARGSYGDGMPTLDEQIEFHEQTSALLRQHSGGHRPRDGDERPSLVRMSVSKRAQHMQNSGNGQRASMSMSGRNSADYTIMWVSGECGISLRNFSAKKVGAQIAVLQQAHGVTTGIANCRLGDQLLAINGDDVEDLRFREIVQKLKATRRPITLAFRTNQNVQTSPTAAGRASAMNRQSSTNRMSMTLPVRGSSSREFFPPEEDYDHELGAGKQDAEGNDWMQQRDTMQSTTSMISEELEMWRRQQEAMHSDIIVLLTETVLRCEKLQQENLDQMQVLMQLAPHVPTAQAPHSSPSPSLSSLAPVASPAEANFRESVLAGKKNMSMLKASTSTAPSATAIATEPMTTA